MREMSCAFSSLEGEGKVVGILASGGEWKIHMILTEAGIPFSEEYVFDDLRVGKDRRPLRFDFAVFDDDGGIDFLIEYQGEQHYHPVSRFGGTSGLRRQRYNDQLKRDYCRKHHLRLVLVPYYDLPKVTLTYLLSRAGY